MSDPLVALGRRKKLPVDQIQYPPHISSARAEPSQPEALTRCLNHDDYLYKVVTLYPYTGSPDDPEELSFAQCEILEVLNNTHGWWQARKADGTTGIVPSIFFHPLQAGYACRGAASASASDIVYQAYANHPYAANPADPTELSFAQGEILDILKNIQDWWRARKQDGTIGIVPSNFVQLIRPGDNLNAPVNPVFKARALGAYTPGPEHSSALALAEGEVLDILDNKQEWWHARKEDGTLGYVPPTFLQPLDTAGVVPTVGAAPQVISNPVAKARALYPYTASPEDPTEISFAEGEIMDILDKSEDWWQARKEDGTTGSVPSNFLQLI